MFVLAEQSEMLDDIPISNDVVLRNTMPSADLMIKNFMFWAVFPVDSDF